MLSQTVAVESQIGAESYGSVRPSWLVQAAIGFGVAITAMDTGGINLSLHTLEQVFGIDAATVAWLPLIGFLTVTSTLLLFGRVADMVGRKRVFLAGFVVYALGALAAGLSPSFGSLLASRGLQAVGMAMLFATGQAILIECFPPHKRGTVVGINSAIIGLGFLAGPIIAGTLISAIGWRYVFLAVSPLCLIGLAVGAFALPRSSVVKGGQFDVMGAVLFAAAAVSLILAVGNVRSASLSSPIVVGFAGAFGLAFAAFIAVERRIPSPMLDLGLFRHRLFSLSVASAFVVFLGISGQEFLLPLFVQKVLLLDPAAAGLVAAIVPLVRMFVAWPSGFLSDRFGSLWVSVVGATLTGLGLLMLSRMDASTTLSWLVMSLLVLGLGGGAFFSPNVHATMASLPPDKLGTAAGAIGLRRNLGQSFGVVLAAYLFQFGGGGSGNPVPGFQLAFLVESLVLAIAILLAFASGSTAIARRK